MKVLIVSFLTLSSCVKKYEGYEIHQGCNSIKSLKKAYDICDRACKKFYNSKVEYSDPCKESCECD